jgi:hypothetical protein
LLSDFKGPLRLMHGSDSGVCTAQQVKDLQREFPKAKVLEVAGAAHPVQFNAAVNKFVLASLELPTASMVKAQPAKAYEQMNMVLEDAPAWIEPTVVTDVPVELMKSVEVMTPVQLPVAQLVELVVELPIEPPPAQLVEQHVAQALGPSTTSPELAAQQLSAQPPSLWTWFKQQLLGATKK